MQACASLFCLMSDSQLPQLPELLTRTLGQVSGHVVLSFSGNNHARRAPARYWEVDDCQPPTTPKLPYRIELVGVTCDPGLAVARGIWCARAPCCRPKPWLGFSAPKTKTLSAKFTRALAVARGIWRARRPAARHVRQASLCLALRVLQAKD